MDVKQNSFTAVKLINDLNKGAVSHSGDIMKMEQCLMILLL